MTDPAEFQHVEIKDGDQTVAAAEVTTHDDHETARASLHAASGHVAPGRRASLVDAVLDLPGVQESTRLEAAVPLGDAESLERLRERTDESSTHAAGATALLDANIRPPAEDPPPAQEPPA
jgi:hypothetical protein